MTEPTDLPVPDQASTDTGAEDAPKRRTRTRRPSTPTAGAGQAETGVAASQGDAPNAQASEAPAQPAASGDRGTNERIPAESASSEATQAEPAAGDRRREGPGARGRFGRRRGKGPRPDQDGAQAAGQPALAPVDPDAVIPVFSRQARVGLDATDPRKRNQGAGPRGAHPDDDAPKLHKLLADTGIGSRREMEELIMAGRVSVNGQPAHVGQRIGPSDQVRVNGRPLNRRVQKPAPKVLLYHKQPGEICSRDDPGQRSTVFERLPRLRGERWVAVGRLDFNTEGLLVFTTSGELANLLMHPRFGWEREYTVRILGRIDEEMHAKLLAGVPLEDGPARLSAIDDVGGDGANHWYRVTIAEGRNREVRRIFEAVGLIVSRLVRIRFGPIGLPPGLARGRWVELGTGDVNTLSTMLKQAGRDAAGTRRGQPAPNGPAAGGTESARPAAGPVEARSRRRPDVDLDDSDDDMPMPAAAELAQPGMTSASDAAAAMPAVETARPAAQRFDDEDGDEDDDDAQPPFPLPGAGGRTGAAGGQRSGSQRVNHDDDEWQPSSADAHLSGITKAVRNQGRQQRFGAGSGFGQPGLPGQPKPPGQGQGQGRRNRKPGQGGFGAGGQPAGPGSGVGGGGQKFGGNRARPAGNRAGPPGPRGPRGGGAGGAGGSGTGGGGGGAGSGGNRGGRRRGPAS